MKTILNVLALLAISVTTLRADDVVLPDEAQVRTAVERGLAVLQRGARNYPEHRRCFSCHHQTLPLLAMNEARAKGIETDAALFASQTKFTTDFFEKRRERLLVGKAVEGAGLTVGYGLWTLAFVAAPRDDNTAAMVHNLIEIQRDDGAWHPEVLRPPMEESRLTCTVFAAYGVRKFATAEQAVAAAKTLDQARQWLRSAPIESQEDRVFRMWGEQLLNDEPQQLPTLRATVLKTQRDDGGWSQMETMASDAYATGLTMFALRECGEATSSTAWQRGVAFLLKTQQADGSWHVRTRATPVQTFFDNGDPHGKDQFLSMAATGWAVASLAASLPKTQ